MGKKTAKARKGNKQTQSTTEGLKSEQNERTNENFSLKKEKKAKKPFDVKPETPLAKLFNGETSAEITELISKELQDVDVMCLKRVNKACYFTIKNSNRNVDENKDIFISDLSSQSQVVDALTDWKDAKENFVRRVARRGDAELLKYAKEKLRLPWDEFTAYDCAEKGNLECLKYAVKNGCAVDAYTIAKASEYGHIKCVKFLHESGCEWDERTCANARRRGHQDILDYCRDEGCPFSD